MNNQLALDNAAMIFPSTMSNKWFNGFRFKITLKDNIDCEMLQKSINNLKKRFCSFFVKLKQGFYWDYFEYNYDKFEVKEYEGVDLKPFSKKESSKQNIRVMHKNNHLYCEFNHIVTDGFGASKFVKNLLAEYFYLKDNIKKKYDEDIVDLSNKPLKEELVDSFNQVKGKKGPIKETHSYHYRGKKDKKNNLVKVSVDSSSLIDLAHSYNSTLTALLCGLSIKSLNEYIGNKRNKREIKINIPVNLRKLYSSISLRNFSLFNTVGVKPNNNYSLEEIIETVSKQLKEKVTCENFTGKIMTNIGIPKNKILAHTPLFIKYPIMRLSYKLFGETSSAITISNLGKFTMDKIYMDKIEDVEYFLTPPKYYPCNCSVVSYNNKTHIIFDRNIVEDKFENIFIKNLKELGIKVETGKE